MSATRRTRSRNGRTDSSGRTRGTGPRGTLPVPRCVPTALDQTALSDAGVAGEEHDLSRPGAGVVHRAIAEPARGRGRRTATARDGGPRVRPVVADSDTPRARCVSRPRGVAVTSVRSATALRSSGSASGLTTTSFGVSKRRSVSTSPTSLDTATKPARVTRTTAVPAAIETAARGRGVVLGAVRAVASRISRPRARPFRDRARSTGPLRSERGARARGVGTPALRSRCRCRPARLEDADQLAILARLDAARRVDLAEQATSGRCSATDTSGSRPTRREAIAGRRRRRVPMAVSPPGRRRGAGGSKLRDVSRFPAAFATAAREPSNGALFAAPKPRSLRRQGLRSRARTARHPSSRDPTARSARLRIERFRRHVDECAARPGVVVAGARRPEQRGDAEVVDVETAASIDQQVSRFEIAMEHPGFVCRGQRVTQVRTEARDLPRCPGAGAAESAARSSPRISSMVRNGVPRVLPVVHAADARVADLAGEPHLFEQAATVRLFRACKVLSATGTPRIRSKAA